MLQERDFGLDAARGGEAPQSRRSDDPMTWNDDWNRIPAAGLANRLGHRTQVARYLSVLACLAKGNRLHCTANRLLKSIAAGPKWQFEVAQFVIEIGGKLPRRLVQQTGAVCLTLTPCDGRNGIILLNDAQSAKLCLKGQLRHHGPRRSLPIPM